MSKPLFEARRKISQVATLLKQGNIVNAIHSFHNGLKTMLAEPLLKSEKDEMEKLLQDAVGAIGYNQKLRTMVPLQLTYTPGEESALLENVTLLLEAFEAAAIEEADKIFREKEAQKKLAIDNGMAELGKGNKKGAEDIFSKLLEDNTTDVSLLVEIAEAFEKAGHIDDAKVYMEKANKLDPTSAYIKNRLGVMHRKLKLYDISEQYFKEAVQLTPDDANIYFNQGRLYVESGKWEDAKHSADQALALKPDFNEALKLSDYAAKRIK